MPTTKSERLEAQASSGPATGCHYLYAPLSDQEHELLSILLQLSPPIKRLRVYFNRTNVVLVGNLKHNRRTVAAKRPTFAQACEYLFAEIEKKAAMNTNQPNLC